MWKNVLFEHADRIALITVNRPDVRNALDRTTVGELHEVFREVSDSEDIGVAILTGAGDRAFVSGADILDIRSRRTREGLQAINSRLFKAVEDCEKPVIAAVNGPAFGGGFELALACDIRICAERAAFALPEVSLGIVPAAGAMYRLQRVAGTGLTKEMVLTGDAVDAQRAFHLGLVSRVVPAAQLIAAAREIAGKILSRGPPAIRLAKRSMNLMPDVSTAAAMEIETLVQAILYESDDKDEGTAAFLEKRPPKFKS